MNKNFEQFDAESLAEQITNQTVGTEQELPQEENKDITKEERMEPIGSLFGNISYYNHVDVPNFFNRMSPNDAIFILLSAARYSQTKGIFTLEESEGVSRAIRVLTMPQEQQGDNETPKA